MPSILKEKKFPFVFAFFLLLILVTFLLISNSSPIPIPTSTNLSDPFSAKAPPHAAVPSSAFSPHISAASPPANGSSSDDAAGSPPPAAGADQAVNAVEWGMCKGETVDFIPCLDNWKAIKELQSRRHMEHRERHCPVPAPRCLIPLPGGYKVPVPWPKSRDMVRSFILWW